jgi:3-oxoisoapionate kinase
VGSLSPVTAAQVAAAQALYEPVALDAHALVGSDAALEALALRCAAALREGRSVLARTTAPADGAPPPQAVAAACGRLLQRVLDAAPAVRRVGVAGGDTASFALRTLDPWALRFAGSLAAGVPLLRVQATDPRLDGLELMLKGGQMGPPDIFERLLRGVA